MKTYFSLRAGEAEYRLRLTMAGQRALREKWGEDILTFLLSAAADGDRLCDLLGGALRWPGNENALQDGAALYDALVDEGWQGQDAFAGLAFDLGRASGLLTEAQTQQLKGAVASAYGAAFAGLASMTGDE